MRDRTKKYYESPDLFKHGRTNFYDNHTRLCGIFIGYIDQNGELFISHPLDDLPRTFTRLNSAKAYIVGVRQSFYELKPDEPEIEQRKPMPKAQLTLF